MARTPVERSTTDDPATTTHGKPTPAAVTMLLGHLVKPDRQYRLTYRRGAVLYFVGSEGNRQKMLMSPEAARDIFKQMGRGAIMFTR